MKKRDWEDKWDEMYFKIMGTWNESKAGRMKALFISLLKKAEEQAIKDFLSDNYGD